MEQEITLREFDPNDARPVYHFLQNAFEVSYRDVYPVEGVKHFKDRYTESFILEISTEGHTLVAERDGELLGTGNLHGAWVGMVYINPLYQHKGIGKLIAGALEERARLENIPALELGAALGSRQFWESLGYTVREEVWVEIENNEKLGFYRMYKDLDRGVT